MRQPKISILTPIYNAESFLKQCAESVINQPFREIEWVCVNDGSTDNSLHILEQYAQKDSRIRVINQTNQGPAVALNRAMENATGEFIHFLDADDYLTDNAYEKPYVIASKNNLDILKVKAYPINAFTGQLIGGTIADRYALSKMSPENYKKPFSFVEFPEKLTSYPVFAPWSGIYRRSFLMDNNIRFNSLRAFADHSFYFTAIAHSRRIMIADAYVLYSRRHNPNSLVGDYVKRFSEHFESFNIIREDCSFLPKKAYSSVLSSEIESIFSWYHKVLNQNDDSMEATQLMNDFARSFDISVINNKCKNSLWYLEYLIIKQELSGESITSSQAKEHLSTEIRKRLPSMKNIRPKSKVVLYGAGTLGGRIYRLFQTSRFCDIVLLVDRKWKDFQSKKLPVYSPDDMLAIEYDYVLICVENKSYVNDIRNWLVQKTVPETKISPFCI